MFGLLLFDSGWIGFDSSHLIRREKSKLGTMKSGDVDEFAS